MTALFLKPTKESNKILAQLSHDRYTLTRHVLQFFGNPEIEICGRDGKWLHISGGQLGELGFWYIIVLYSFFCLGAEGSHLISCELHLFIFVAERLCFSFVSSLLYMCLDKRVKFSFLNSIFYRCLFMA